MLRRIRAREKSTSQLGTNVRWESGVHVGQFYGIEIEEFPARIAETAIYLVDHLENLSLSAEFGQYYARFPITDSAHVTIGNALRLDWSSVLPTSAASCCRRCALSSTGMSPAKRSVRPVRMDP